MTTCFPGCRTNLRRTRGWGHKLSPLVKFQLIPYQSRELLEWTRKRFTQEDEYAEYLYVCFLCKQTQIRKM